jgi:hypothetical protein
VNNEVKLKMPIWRHPIINKVLYQQACRREAATCLRLNHQAQSVEDILTIARRRTTVTRKPHQVNPSGIGRKNCGCPLCYQDRTLLGCKHPGQCIETARILVDSILAKWNPTMPNLDLCQELALTDDEKRWNSQPIETNQIMVFDPNFALSDMGSGFRIFAFEDSLNTIPARRYKITGQVPSLMTVFINARVFKPDEFDSGLNVIVKTETDLTQRSENLSLTFDRPEIPLTFHQRYWEVYCLYYSPLSQMYHYWSAPPRSTCRK